MQLYFLQLLKNDVCSERLPAGLKALQSMSGSGRPELRIAEIYEHIYVYVYIHKCGCIGIKSSVSLSFRFLQGNMLDILGLIEKCLFPA